MKFFNQLKKATIYLFFFFFLPLISQAQSYTGKVKTIDIINWTHTDYGFTDHPLIVAELHKRYIDIALDFAEQTKNNKPGERFNWTVESRGPFWEWWQEATPARREKMLQCIKRGQIDVNRMPFNMHPILNGVENEKIVSWIPQNVSAQLGSRIAIQNDVNGFSRAIASKLVSKGIKYIYLGMNGRLPFNKPTATWWQMPDGKKIFLWGGVPYWSGYDWFQNGTWRAGPSGATSLLSRWPREGDIFKSDEASVKKAYKICVKKLNELEKKGYSYEALPITLSNQWRSDNDGPFIGIVAFVKKWNELGLKPALNLTTITRSMENMEKAVGGSAATITGEFGDWWAFGLSAQPRETAVARYARFQLQAVKSPVFAPLTKAKINRIDEIDREICTYAEHTFAANSSSKDMYGVQNQGSMNEGFRHVYKAYEYSNWLLAQQARTLVNGKPGGIYVINTQQTEYSGWNKVNKRALRSEKKIESLLDVSTGKNIKLYPDSGDLYFWVDKLAPHSVRRFTIQDTAPDADAPSQKPHVTVSATGWPTAIQWSGMSLPLFSGEAPNIHVAKFITGGWWAANVIHSDYAATPAEIARVTETPHTVVYSQKLNNDRLVSAERILTIYKNEPRANIKIVFDRKLHTQREEEVIYAEFPFNNVKREVTTSNGGIEFRPYTDNIANTCKSTFVADSWVKFTSKEGSWLWSSKTSPIFELGKYMFFKKGDIKEPENSYLLQSMLYNNAWGVNFPAEYSGKTVCEYDISYSPAAIEKNQADQISDTYLVGPVVIVNPDLKENSSYNKWLNDNDVQ